jgi:hypothetical protein
MGIRKATAASTLISLTPPGTFTSYTGARELPPGLLASAPGRGDLGLSRWRVLLPAVRGAVHRAGRSRGGAAGLGSEGAGARAPPPPVPAGLPVPGPGGDGARPAEAGHRTRACGTPPTGRDRRTARHGQHPKITTSRTVQASTSGTRKIEVKPSFPAGTLKIESNWGVCDKWCATTSACLRTHPARTRMPRRVGAKPCYLFGVTLVSDSPLVPSWRSPRLQYERQGRLL